MFRLLVVFVTVLALVSATTLAAAQEEDPCPTSAESLAATPVASPMATPVASPTASPTAEPKASPTVSPTASPTTAESCAVVIQGFAFIPAEIEIEAGTTVIWTNLDGSRHTATADDDSFDTGQLSQNQSSAPVPFDSIGVFPYHCDEHPDFMFGTVRVS